MYDKRIQNREIIERKYHHHHIIMDISQISEALDDLGRPSTYSTAEKMRLWSPLQKFE